MKKVVVIVLTIAVLIAGFLFVNNTLNNQFSLSDKSKFREAGYFKKARITNAYSIHEYSGKGIQQVYHLDLSYFVKKDDLKFGETKLEDLKKENQSLDEILEDIKVSGDIGDYTTTSLRVSKKEYDLLKEERDIEIYYLKLNPEKVILNSRLD